MAKWREGAPRGDDEAGFHAALWQRLRWAGMWPAAKQWPKGTNTLLRNEYVRLDELPIVPEEKTRALKVWLAGHLDPKVVEREVEATARIVRDFDLPHVERPPVRRQRLVMPDPTRDD